MGAEKVDREEDVPRRQRATTTADETPAGEHPPRFVVLEGVGAGRKYILDQARMIVGRADEAEVRFDDPQMSRHHAELMRDDESIYRIVDLGSSNGTFVNGAPAEQATQLKPGDKVRFGPKTLVLFTPHDPVEEQLLQRQRLEALGRLGAGTAHDFNNMLGAVLSNLEYLATLDPSRKLGDREVTDALDDVALAARRAAELSQRLVTFARGEASEGSTLDASEAVTEVTQLARHTFGRNIEVEVELAGGRLWVSGSSLELHQVVMNLCLNARDAMPFGGTVKVSAQRTRDADGEWIEIRVQDDGSGMTAKTISRAFDPFFTTKRSGAGFGLGLSTVRDVIHVMGGSITVESELGQGSTFTILLPAARPVSKQHQPLTDSRHTPARVSERRLTVLLIDDEQTVRRGTRRVLQSVGLQVLEASNGADGIRLYGERDPRPDAVLLDLEMPGLTGEDTLEALRELDPGVRVVMVSGHRDNARVRQLKASGAVAFVYKPWTLNELLDALDAAVEVPEPAQSTTVDEG